MHLPNPTISQTIEQLLPTRPALRVSFHLTKWLLYLACDDTPAKRDGDLGECGDEPIMVQPEESMVVDSSLDLGEDVPKGKSSFIVVNVA